MKIIQRETAHVSIIYPVLISYKNVNQIYI